MDGFVNKIVIKVNKNVYLKSPESSVLGEKILRGSIDLIDEIGFEEFTFKKLAKNISSTEASVYRYFESKHHVLIYLVLWYWGWQEYRLVMRLMNIDDPRERLRRAVELLTERVEKDSNFSEIDELKLNRIVIKESSKVYLSNAVEKDNERGFFNQYKDIVNRVANIILEINPNFQYAQMLVSTVIEGAHHQRFFAEHLPRLTNVIEGEDVVTSFYTELVFNEIESSKRKL
jgi:AcrR family transcriptional regulator